MPIITLKPIHIFLLSYIVAINVLSFTIYAIDKMKANNNAKNRISEKTLWLLALFGGSIGALLAMKLFRHKTKKIEFQALLAVIITIQIMIIWLIITYY